MSCEWESQDPVSDTEPEDHSLLSNPLIALYRDVAIRIEQAADPVRTKKMLYCLCYDSWENNTSQIEQMDTTALVEGMYAKISTVQALQEKLKIILLRLNRKAKYSPIANTIFKECRVLYPDIDSQISMPGVARIEESNNTENTQINIQKKPTTRWSQPPQAAKAIRTTSDARLGKASVTKVGTDKAGHLSASANSTISPVMFSSPAFGS